MFPSGLDISVQSCLPSKDCKIVSSRTKPALLSSEHSRYALRA
jgi:hypothetical protein